MTKKIVLLLLIMIGFCLSACTHCNNCQIVLAPEHAQDTDY
ncbi:MAG: hypothetical protein NTU49_09650 [Gammaproteobacteria bacterium]|nr:hypothetical protein [Gammaproteobacteria bacterium]